MIDKRERFVDLYSIEARNYFLRGENYFTVPLPKYFDFGGILKDVSERLREYDYNMYELPRVNGVEGINHRIYMSKDGGVAGRGFHLIHPVLYVELANLITEEENWELVRERLQLYGLQNSVISKSLVPMKETSKRAVQSSILKWYHGMEQKTIELALFYGCMVKTDIAECYGTYRARLIELALGGDLGPKVGRIIRAMMSGEEVGIPQGSALVDFVAEIGFGHLDTEIHNAIRAHKIRDYEILRFRDDYRIFARNSAMAGKILGIIADVMRKNGFRLNVQKTAICEDILSEARKEDKGYYEHHFGAFGGMMGGEGYCGRTSMSAQKELFAIREMSLAYPNSGSVVRALADLYERKISRMEHKPDDVYQLISLTADIVAKNPRSCQAGVAILSKMMSFNPGISRNHLVDRILDKAGVMTDVEYLEIWLQRLTVKNRPGKRYRNGLSRMFYETNRKIWNSDWLTMKIDDALVLDRKMVREMDFVIPVEELRAFSDYDEEVGEFRAFVG